MVKPPRWRQKVQNALFYCFLFSIVTLIAWLSREYPYQGDWTYGARNTLSDTTRQLLDSLQQPLDFTAFIAEDTSLRQRISERIERYLSYKPEIRLHFVNPDLEPDRAAKTGITHPGQLLISMGGRSEASEDMSERGITNALQRLIRGEPRWAAFLQGHGERDPLDNSNQGLSQIVEPLKHSGFNIQPLNLIRTPLIPDNISVLVIAAPQANLLEGELNLIHEYIKTGGNLLWLQDPGEMHGLQSVAVQLGIRFIDGIIVDANQQLRQVLGIQHPAVVPVVDYPVHSLTRGVKTQTLFPFAIGIAQSDDSLWLGKPFLKTLARSWSETGNLIGKELIFNKRDGDTPGPLNIGMSLTRNLDDYEQRVVVIGDSDFLANGYLGNGGNQILAINTFNWLSRDESLISVLPKSAPDTQLELSNATAITLASTFLLAIPLGLLIMGYGFWFKRKRQ